MSMQLDTAQRARQQVLQKMAAELSIFFVRELLSEIGLFSRQHLCNDEFFRRAKFVRSILRCGSGRCNTRGNQAG